MTPPFLTIMIGLSLTVFYHPYVILPERDPDDYLRSIFVCQ